jgi:hypothetical protein
VAKLPRPASKLKLGMDLQAMPICKSETVGHFRVESRLYNSAGLEGAWRYLRHDGE